MMKTAISVAIGITYHILQGILIALGYSGVLPPLVAAWAPNLLFGLIGVVVILLAPVYSRLVIDCNRPIGVPSSIAEQSGGVDIPGNQNLDDEAKGARAESCYWPYHRALERILDAREERGEPTVFVTIHSFTPALLGVARPWHAAVLHRKGSRIAPLLLEGLRRFDHLVIGENEPYRVTDGGDYSVPVHGEARGLPSALLEMRNDGVRSTEVIRRNCHRQDPQRCQSKRHHHKAAHAPPDAVIDQDLHCGIVHSLECAGTEVGQYEGQQRQIEIFCLGEYCKKNDKTN